MSMYSVDANAPKRDADSTAGKALTIRLNRDTIFTVVLLLLLVVASVQSIEIGKIKRADASSTKTVAAAPTTSSSTGTSSGSQSSALQGIPSQVGGC